LIGQAGHGPDEGTEIAGHLQGTGVAQPEFVQYRVFKRFYKKGKMRRGENI
jgi:hypothetical protein